MLIMIPLTAFIIGPIGVYVGAGLGDLLKSINDFSPFIFAIVIPLAYPFMVPLGLHWPINAIMLINIQTLGYDFIQGPMGAWNFACFGATAGVLLPRLAGEGRADEADRDRRVGRGSARRHLRTIALRYSPAVQADLPTHAGRLLDRRPDHRHRRRRDDQRLRVHLAADDPRVRPDRAVRHRRHRGVRHRDGAGDPLRLPHTGAAGRVRGLPRHRRGSGDGRPRGASSATDRRRLRHQGRGRQPAWSPRSRRRSTAR